MATAPTDLRMPLPLTSARHHNGAAIDYELFLDCVHCGLCTSSCPTYLESGDENDSPRGRIYLMRGVTDGRLSLTAEVQRHLDLCLDCRGCETACPSGVQYGRLIEPFRNFMTQSGVQTTSPSWLTRLLLFHVTPYADRTRLALAPARLLQRTGLDRFLAHGSLSKLLPRSLRRLHDMLPRLQPHYGRLPAIFPARGKPRARVALFRGCAGDAFFPQTTFATALVLQQNGCDVLVPRGQTCCGALHYHAGRPGPARGFAVTNCKAFLEEADRQGGDVDAIVVNAAGCGAQLKDYGHLLQATPLAEAGARLAGKVRDVSEFLMALEPTKPRHPLPIRAAYHDACHLCHGQQIRQPPRDLLALIPGLQLTPLAESEICCGAAGSYNLTQPEMAERLGQRKATHVREAKVHAVFAGNVGCLLQIGRYLRPSCPDLWVAHPVDALWAAYSGKGLSPAGKLMPGKVQ